MLTSAFLITLPIPNPILPREHLVRDLEYLLPILPFDVVILSSCYLFEIAVEELHRLFGVEVPPALNGPGCLTPSLNFVDHDCFAVHAQLLQGSDVATAPLLAEVVEQEHAAELLGEFLIVFLHALWADFPSRKVQSVVSSNERCVELNTKQVCCRES